MKPDNSFGSRKSSRRVRLIGTVLSLGLLITLLWRQDWAQIAQSLANLPWWILLLSFTFLALRHAFNALRWFWLVRAQDIPLSYARSLQLVFAGLFVSNFLPSMVGGDVVRITGVMVIARNRVAGAASVVVDRLVGVFGMFFVLPFSLPLIKIILAEGGLAGLIGSTVAGQRSREVFQRGVQRSKEALAMWWNRPFSLVQALLTSWLAVASYLFSAWMMTRGVGMQVSIFDVAGVSVLTYFLTMIPLSINGYGVRELAIVGFYTQLGATVEQAMAFALVTRILFLLVSLPGAAWAGNVLPSRAQKLEQGDESS